MNIIVLFTLISWLITSLKIVNLNGNISPFKQLINE